MATPDVAAHLSPADLGRRYRAARDPIARSHLQIVWLSGQGRSGREVAAVTGYSRRWIGTIVQRYAAAGPDGLGDRRATNAGAKPLLDADGEAALIGLKPILRRQWAPVGRRPIARGRHR